METASTTPETAALSAQIEAKEQQLTALHAELNALRRELGGMPVPDYALTDGDGNTVQLSAAFGPHDRMLLIHNMGFACPYCTLWAEGFSHLAQHFESGEYTAPLKFVLVSNDRPDQQRAGAAQRGWTFTLLSARGTSLFDDLGFAERKDGELYWWPGVSALVKQPDGTLRRTGKAFFGPGDAYCGFWHLLELFPPGGQTEPAAAE
jgi:peroxiredoxin